MSSKAPFAVLAAALPMSGTTNAELVSGEVAGGKDANESDRSMVARSFLRVSSSNAGSGAARGRLSSSIGWLICCDLIPA
jgi:hypothetical protein